LRFPRRRASSCWLYSIDFIAVYGSIVDPAFLGSRSVAANCRTASLRLIDFVVDHRHTYRM
jgi:hypothetical protein